MPASVRTALDPLIGHKVRVEDDENEHGPHVAGALGRWALHERETAKEWARELDMAIEVQSRYETPELRDKPIDVLEVAALSMVADGYAFALAMLLCSEEHAAQALYSMTRTWLAMLVQAFEAPAPWTKERQEVYRVASAPWRGMLERWAWGTPFEKALGATDRFPCATHPESPGAMSIECCALCAAETRASVLGEITPRMNKADVTAKARASRARGFLPHRDPIPRKAFRIEESATEVES